MGEARGPAASLPSPYDDGELYERVFHGLDMDIEFFSTLAKEARGPVLELGCGTGRVTLPCLEAGAEVDGLDLYPSMLEVLRRKAEARDLRVRLHRADMRAFSLPRRFALVTIPFNAFLHNLTTEDQLATLSRCRDHLAPGGVLVVHASLFTSPEILSSTNAPVLELETVDPGTGHTLQHYDTRSIDPVNQIQHSINEVRELDRQGRLVSSRRTETAVRWVNRAELELLLRVAGFTRWKLYGGFRNEPLDVEHQQMVAFAWKDSAEDRS